MINKPTENSPIKAYDELQTDGINDLITSGTNAKGRWTKFADGTMICTMIKDFTLGTSTFQVGDFPLDFFSKPNCSFSIDANPVSGDGYAFLGKIGQVQIITVSASQFAIFTRNTPAGTEIGKAYVTAIGRWK